MIPPASGRAAGRASVAIRSVPRTPRLGVNSSAPLFRRPQPRPSILLQPTAASLHHTQCHVPSHGNVRLPLQATNRVNTAHPRWLPGRVLPACKRYSLSTTNPRSGEEAGGGKGPNKGPIVLSGVGAVAVLFAGYQWWVLNGKGHETGPPDNRPSNLPRFRLSEVRQHGADSHHPWVTYEDKVYDITDWVGAHPGGDVILRAAGGSIEPYWKIFAIHQTSYAKEVLAQFLVGYVHSADLGPDGKPATSEVEDPFADDPARDPRLQTLSAKPRSAETPQDDLADHFLTPTRTFYVRNHMWVPGVNDADKHVLTIQLPDGDEKAYTLAELKAKFKTHRITAALQCAGNRRSHMSEMVGPTNGLQWGVGAISNAEWEGVKLVDVLADAAGAGAGSSSSMPPGPWNQSLLFGSDAKHVWFSGLEAYGASIPLETAFDPKCDVLLAFGMNGAPLPADHGFPLRALVPGHVAARSVKYLNRVTVAEEESPTQWQRRDYKCFGPNQTENLDWDSAPAIQEMPVTSAITRVTINSNVPWRVKGNCGGTMVKTVSRDSNKDGGGKSAGETGGPGGGGGGLSLRGYAYSGGGKEIIRVDVSMDGGQTWQQAQLLDNCKKREAVAKAAGEDESCKGSKSWAWKRWECNTELPSGSPSCLTLVVKATDETYNTQPQDQASVFNPRGNLATAWQRLTLCPNPQPRN
ncbi:hypothetical protein MKZ38_003906 [Zalerion maritima]|uniref:Nitrate reductase [NADPH] n=1 Tax=Zalerion maritima TaxID=339359 RepID=A0AAD5WXI4_9PEZI|nr:hypothetical protein MKZ38_003906 [Zalerion maritima]